MLGCLVHVVFAVAGQYASGVCWQTRYRLADYDAFSSRANMPCASVVIFPTTPDARDIYQKEEFSRMMLGFVMQPY